MTTDLRFENYLEMALVVSEATLNLDNYLSGNMPAQTSEINQLAQILRNSSKDAKNGKMRISSTPCAYDLIVSYFGEIKEAYIRPLQIEHIAPGLEMIAEELERFDQLSKEGLQALRNACLNFSRTFLRHYQRDKYLIKHFAA